MSGAGPRRSDMTTTIFVDYGNVKMEVPFEDVSWLQPLGE